MKYNESVKICDVGDVNRPLNCSNLAHTSIHIKVEKFYYIRFVTKCRYWYRFVFWSQISVQYKYDDCKIIIKVFKLSRLKQNCEVYNIYIYDSPN